MHPTLQSSHYATTWFWEELKNVHLWIQVHDQKLLQECETTKLGWNSTNPEIVSKWEPWRKWCLFSHVLEAFITHICEWHWGQGVVSWASTLQIHHKEMDKVPIQYPPSIPQVHSEFSKPIFLQFSQHRKWSAHLQCSRSCDWDFPIRKILGMFKVFPKNVTVMFLSGSFKDFFVVSPVVWL